MAGGRKGRDRAGRELHRVCPSSVLTGRYFSLTKCTCSTSSAFLSSTELSKENLRRWWSWHLTGVSHGSEGQNTNHLTVSRQICSIECSSSQQRHMKKLRPRRLSEYGECASLPDQGSAYMQGGRGRRQARSTCSRPARPHGLQNIPSLCSQLDLTFSPARTKTEISTCRDRGCQTCLQILHRRGTKCNICCGYERHDVWRGRGGWG